MVANKEAQGTLNDLNAKLRNAKHAASTDQAGDREKADLKLLEQEVAAEKMKANRPVDPAKPPPTGVEAKLDKALRDSFPGSDPVSFLEAAPIKKADRSLSTVPDEPKSKNSSKNN